MNSPAKLAACRANWKKALAVIGNKPIKRVQVTCQNCGTDFQVEPYREYTAKFCSAPCRQKGNARKNTGEKLRGTGSKNGYIKFHGRHMHRVVMEKKIGRSLKSGEVVHHEDRNRRNNGPENLALLPSQSEHINLHRDVLWGSGHTK